MHGLLYHKKSIAQRRNDVEKHYENKYAFAGFNRAGNPIEVYYNPIGDDIIKVFHVMKYRSSSFNQNAE